MEINLKLAIISCLNRFGLYKDEAKKIKLRVSYGRPYDELSYDDVVPEVYDYYKNLVIDEGHLGLISEFNPSAANDCYRLVVKEWSGEDDIFDIESLDGISTLLPNLTIFNPERLMNEYSVDIADLLNCKNLTTVHKKCIPETDETSNVIEKLREKGVKII